MFQEPARKQVNLRVYDNEPTVRMAEQRLQLEGIPCLVRSLGGGPGLWGTAYNLPHDLLVYEGDESRAWDILKIVPREERKGEQLSEMHGEQRSQLMPQWMVTATIVAIVAFIALTVVIANRAVR
jgi:hypothetical protein